MLYINYKGIHKSFILFFTADKTADRKQTFKEVHYET